MSIAERQFELQRKARRAAEVVLRRAKLHEIPISAKIARRLRGLGIESAGDLTCLRPEELLSPEDSWVLLPTDQVHYWLPWRECKKDRPEFTDPRDESFSEAELSTIDRRLRSIGLRLGMEDDDSKLRRRLAERIGAIRWEQHPRPNIATRSAPIRKIKIDRILVRGNVVHLCADDSSEQSLLTSLSDRVTP